MKVIVELYGLFEKFNVGAELTVELEPESERPLTLKEFKKIFSNALEKKSKKRCEVELLKDCAFANASEIIGDDYVIKTSEKLSVLPPICGG